MQSTSSFAAWAPMSRTSISTTVSSGLARREKGSSSKVRAPPDAGMPRPSSYSAATQPWATRLFAQMTASGAGLADIRPCVIRRPSALVLSPSQI